MLPWRPPEKVPFGISCGERDQAVVARLGIALVAPARFPCRIEQQRRVVHGRGTWPKFPRLDVSLDGRRDRNHEVPQLFGPGRSQPVRSRQANDEVRLAKLPPVLPFRFFRQLSQIARPCALGNPLLKDRDLRGGQAAVPYELAESRFSLPRWP